MLCCLSHSDVGMCRICHEGAGGETLLSPCDCTGTLGKVHKSCLEKWLSSSNTSYCELCHTEFTIERRPQPLTQVRKVLLCEFISLLYVFFYKKRLVCGFILGAPVASHCPQTLVRFIGDSELTVWLSASMNGCLFLCMRPVIDWVYPTSSLMSGGIGSNLGSVRG